MTRIKNVDCDGKPIKSGDRVEFNGSKLMGQYWIEHGKIEYDWSRNKWFFVGAESTHGAVTDWSPRKRIFKYYRRINDLR